MHGYENPCFRALISNQQASRTALSLAGCVLLDTGNSFGGLLGGLLPADSPFANVFTTLGVAALFQPLRIWIQRGIDRRFYRRRYDAARALEAFSTTLRNQINLEQLHKRILSVVEETMQPIHVSLWLCEPVRPSVPETANSGPLEPVIRSTGLLAQTSDLNRYRQYTEIE
ncbi:MAG TPA: hypothetical protein VFN35_13690 [Ktedonobacteraceae bacterium]|nr:hypothetical protein [Ktedonobacteraceae bacterium]